MQDLTVIYYTANYISEKFAENTKKELLKAVGELPIIVVSFKPSLVGERGKNTINNIFFVTEIERSHLNIYRQALVGAKAAKTKYIALVEDDVLYHPDHFKYRPPEGVFGYNMNVWSIFTWVKPPIFNYKDRINLSGLICERNLFIEAMEERFAKYPDDSKIDLSIFAEPGKYEGHLGVTKRQFEKFYSDNPNVVFSHETALSFDGLGKRKAMGKVKAIEIPYWGRAEDVVLLYQ